MPLRHFFAALTILVLPPAAFAGPRDDLLRLVPNDYTFCVVVQNLREHLKSDGNSVFLKGITDHPLFKGLQHAPEAQKIQQVFETLMKELMVTPEQVRDDLIGDALVFAYRKGPPGQEGKEDGLILLNARDDKLLARLIDRINELQTKAGELKAVETVGSGPGAYSRRVKAVEMEPADFYALRGHRLAFSGHEVLLKSVLPTLAAEGTAEPPIAQRMKRLGINDSPVSVLINPRSFDAEVAGSAQSGKGSEQAFLKQFASYWKAVDGLALFLNVRPSIEIGVTANVRKAELPKAAAQFFTEAGKCSAIWDRIPDDALFAVAGRIHAESFAAMLGTFLTDPDRKKVLDTVADATRPFLETEDFGPLLRGIGPDFGFWVTAPDPSTKSWCPQATLAVKIGDSPDGQQAEQAALKGLDFLARFACLQHKGLRVRSEKQGPIEVRCLTHPTAFPPAFRPAFASKGGYIVVAESPGTLNRFEPPTAQATDAAETPILRVSATAWRKYLKEHQKPLVEYLSNLKGADPKELAGQIDTLLPILEGLDRFEIVQRSGPERVMLVMRFAEVKK
ncbi:MAG TPA: hypothetical protein VHR66_07485 [Gemmataceae bacterium]|jgi:hypothetical protein|nr:hypothetical protein [Gemmataceae bacterium]